MTIKPRLALLGALAMGLGAAQAQTATTPATPAPAAPAVTAPAPGASRGTAETPNPGDRAALVDASALEAGANSFTEGQARARLEDAGFTAIEGLTKDEQGFWRGRAVRGGQAGEVAMDFRGRIAAAPTLAALGAPRREGTAPAPSTGTPPATR